MNRICQRCGVISDRLVSDVLARRRLWGRARDEGRQGNVPTHARAATGRARQLGVVGSRPPRHLAHSRRATTLLSRRGALDVPSRHRLNPAADNYSKNNFARPLTAWQNWKIKGGERGEVNAGEQDRFRVGLHRSCVLVSTARRGGGVRLSPTAGCGLVTECANSSPHPCDKFAALATKPRVINPALLLGGVARSLRVGLQEGQHGIRRLLSLR
jgi:hypothetical protein